MKISECLLRIRKECGLTQTELAKRTDIKQQNISRWELGIHIPNIEDCIKLADFYRVSLDELVNRAPY